jgi:hypothetical protein
MSMRKWQWLYDIPMPSIMGLLQIILVGCIAMVAVVACGAFVVFILRELWKAWDR